MVSASHPLSLSRTYHDPLHGAIALDGADPTEALLIQLIDLPEFQRLRRIRQLGPASLTFHGAESSRFTHSLGVMAIARRAFDRLAQINSDLKPYRTTVLCAALLHDIGHGPFSHTCEEVFGSHHELWTRRILRESTVCEKLEQTDPDLLSQIELVYQKQHPIPFVWQLVSSQLDCDRLDYLMRDSHFTGVSYGKLDLDRILMALHYDPISQQLVVAAKGMAAVEHYLVVRYFMYAQVYNHPKNLAASWVLEQAFRRARGLFKAGELTVDDTVAAWLQQNCDELAIADYLNADDGVFLYHLQQWQRHGDPVLSDLSRRFVNRDLLKAFEVTHLTSEEQYHLLAEIQTLLQQQGVEPDYYTALRNTFSRGYTLYQRGIKLQTDTVLQEISELSPLVQTLTQPRQRIWLLYPRHVEPALTRLR